MFLGDRDDTVCNLQLDFVNRNSLLMSKLNGDHETWVCTLLQEMSNDRQKIVTHNDEQG